MAAFVLVTPISALALDRAAQPVVVDAARVRSTLAAILHGLVDLLIA